MDLAREKHWQEAWARAGISRGRADPGKEKYYALVAYPGSSGFLHVGHLRGLAYADVLHRFHRLQGRAVFFPTGTHVSGLPAVTFAQKVAERDPTVVRQLEEHGVPPSEWPRLEDPESAGRYLGRSFLSAYRSFGLLVDEAAYVTTIDEDYRAFIRWQFHRLDEAGALGQAPHFAAVCPVCGPVSVDPSETDLSRGGAAEWVLFHTIPFDLPDGRQLLAATLRPETVYGVTNVWIPPEGSLATWHHGARRILVAPAGGRRLVEQHGGHLGAEFPARDLDGTTVTVPLTGARVPVLANPLVDPTIGTGVVMSVPAHAPADWAAVHALHEHHRHRIGPIPTIIAVDSERLAGSERELLSGDGAPAERALRAIAHAASPTEEEVEEATERLYRTELLRGRMAAGPFAGLPVAEARPEVARALADRTAAPELREFSEPVVCRNGHEVVIRKVPDQWFLRYGDPAWKAKSREAAGHLTVHPEEYARELPDILEWLADRPCTRRGRWLGTPFPNDESWIIEPIADSTLYPAYFPIRPFVALGEIPVSALTDAFFDYVILGRGPGEPMVPAPVLARARAAFEYWYPLDLNIAGKEHKRVHCPVFVATHALLLPAPRQPRGLFVHGWLTGPGGSKISKKAIGAKGGVIPSLHGAFERWGADALRLVYATSASPSQDLAWDPDLAEAASGRLREIERLARTGFEEGVGGPPELERWLASRTHDLLREYVAHLEGCRIRDAGEVVFVAFPNVLRRYTLRGGQPGPALARTTLAWVLALSPFAPHLAEELGEGRVPHLVADARLPEPEHFDRAPGSLRTEALIERVEEDLREVLRPAKARGPPPDELVLFVAAGWKTTVEDWVRESPTAGGAPPAVRELMERAKAHPELAARRSELPAYVARIAATARSEPAGELTPREELAFLRASTAYLVRRFQLRSLTVVPEEEGEALDPLGRRVRARPGRPAIYLFGRPRTPSGDR